LLSLISAFRFQLSAFCWVFSHFRFQLSALSFFDNMKIIHISTNDIAGGAARAAYRLHTGLCRLGHDSQMLVKHKLSCDPHVHVFQTGWPRWRRLLGWLRAQQIAADLNRYPSATPNNGVLFTDDRSRFGDAVARTIPDCDVVNLHWVGLDFVDYEGFFRVMAKRRIPVVWTMHDMNPFTGGCHYTGGCERYRERCGGCPVLRKVESRKRKSEIEMVGESLAEAQRAQRDQEPRTNNQELFAPDLSSAIWERKRRAFDQAVAHGLRLQLVSPSRWLADCARQSSLLARFPVHVQPNGLDAEQFRGLDAVGMRQALGVHPDARVVLFVAENVSDRRKGLSLLLTALRRLHLERINVHLVGVGTSRPVAGFDGLKVSFTGEIASETLMALVYSAADVFVIPSLEDNLPNTVLEAMACGTPVVGFDTGGIPDMVRQGKTGLLAPVGDVDALADAIRTILGDAALRQRMVDECRATVLREFTLERQATAYVDVYERFRKDVAVKVNT
jgi:glycosyltransferase involved in cell wall biosynthesis